MPRAQRERQMLDVAVQVFAQRGYVATSMDEIAERVGVSKPMLYEYFNSKEGLLLAAIRDARNELRLVTEQATVGATSGKEALERGLLAFFRFIDGRKEAWSLLRQEMAFIGSSASEEVEAIREQQTALNAKLLQAYLPIGAQREAEAAAEMLVGACERIAVWCERHDDITPELATQYTMNLIWDGLANRQAAAESTQKLPTTR
ncbi:MAG: TetR family transcriptional regulator [Actinophytocola sp.]|nr:TetR family transcriptional regulator [Actinophytocola sp.]